MKVVIAPDSFKESLSAEAVARALADGWRSLMPDAELVELPLADGGEGTTQALVAATGGEMVRCRATGPLGQPVEAFWGRIDGARAVIECAAASGLDLVSRDARDPWHATTWGTGELILAALNSGARHIIVGLGGSATNDGGAGMLQALGVKLLDAKGEPINPGAAGLAQLAQIDISAMDGRLADVRFEVACDVDNPLTGPEGASAIFGPQKGADEALVGRMDEALRNYDEQIQRCLGRSVDKTAGAGAAGGLGSAFLAFLNAELKPGIEIILDAVDIESHLQGADLLITGEGRIDGQTARGKTPVGVARRAMQYRVPCIAVGGSVPTELALLDQLAEQGIRAVFPILPGVSALEEALADAERNLRLCGRNLAAYWRCCQF
ncbi:glycerate kinase [Marinobacterium zhoushanense]|uniref:Glycerate kinase n=1 Tax=Marinobacterium zhoushanense TaxID=1679163 RepID=A0ABQ1KPL3_9GAMM|nr:glycerate kinase [Marinobacterium zhoushanense]GGC06514.1 glycerate kinase [Marinobacterium zhoushanense]